MHRVTARTGTLEDIISRDNDRWFRSVRRGFARRVREFSGKPIVYVEIGCWLGASASWIALNVLTHPESMGYGIDPYTELRKSFTEDGKIKHAAEEMRCVRDAAHGRMAALGNQNWAWIEETSEHALSTWPHGNIDLLYIDGQHSSMNVVLDFVLAWPHLRVGSGVIFDDYEIGARRGVCGVPEAITAIDLAWGNLLEPWRDNHIGRQAYFKVRKKDTDPVWADGQLDRQRWLRRTRKHREQQGYVACQHAHD